MTRIVAAALLVWEPVNLATAALTVLPTLAYRGWVVALELLVHGVIAAVAAAGGLALWNGSPSATRLASIAIVLSALRTVQSLYWTMLPTSTMPGDELLIAGTTTALACVGLATVHLTRSGRVFQ